MPTPAVLSLQPSPLRGIPTFYIVQAGDTLSAIAQEQQTTVAAIKMANRLIDDLIYPDQPLIIPGAIPTLALAPVVVPVVATPITVQPLSILEGDLAAAYPLTMRTERFTLHYAPDPLPAHSPDVLANLTARALAHHEQMLQVTLSGRFDVYVAGSPFAPPDQSLRGHSYSADRYFVFLDDGSGNLDDVAYLIAHELTHMFVWLLFGRPTDPMLSEGAAVYVGMDFIAHAQHMPMTTFCAAYQQLDRLPWVSTRLTYQGHIRDLENYYSAGCFVKYLIETYGIEKFGRLYPSNDYSGIYGKTLAQLDAEWHTAFAATLGPVPFDAGLFIHLVERLKGAHATLFKTFTGTTEQMAEYRTLDQVRMALLEGRLADVQRYFEQ
ncbi:MAG: LysM peptidoglycan-binding domain-containing protein [Caldilineaceae bacterium]|nr:LysM peptidoglycan-binding domain-containing protein [Caldilineaceae bacterium]